MNIKRKLLIGLLAFGTVAGFGFEFARYRAHAHGGCASWGRHHAEAGAASPRRTPGAEGAP